MFRRENKADAFDRQLGALRDQLGDDDYQDEQQDEPMPAPPSSRDQPARGYGFAESAPRRQQVDMMPEPEPPATPMTMGCLRSTDNCSFNIAIPNPPRERQQRRLSGPGRR